jgi:hypothetical protein
VSTNGGISRLRAVRPTEGEGNALDLPADVLRFGALPDDRRTLLLQVSDFLEEIDYGAVVVVMHDGNVAQIETSEKIRLSREPSGNGTPRSS